MAQLDAGLSREGSAWQGEGPQEWVEPALGVGTCQGEQMWVNFTNRPIRLKLLRHQPVRQDYVTPSGAGSSSSSSSSSSSPSSSSSSSSPSSSPSSSSSSSS